jgi:hypothetical protein
VNWYLHGARDREIDPAPVLFNNESLVETQWRCELQNNIFPMLIYKLPLHVFKGFVWCAVSTDRNTESFVRCQIK